MECFTHGKQLECPECPPFGKRKDRRHQLEVLSINYSGSGTDVGACPECGKAYSISYKVDVMEPCPSWNIPSRVEVEEKDRERKEASEKAVNQRDLIEYERLKKKFGEITDVCPNRK